MPADRTPSTQDAKVRDAKVKDAGEGQEGTPTAQHASQLRAWRRSSQRVVRAWNAWLAADSRDREPCYGAFVRALAEEEQAAAEVERLAQLSEAREYASSGR